MFTKNYSYYFRPDKVISNNVKRNTIIIKYFQSSHQDFGQHLGKMAAAQRNIDC